MRYLPFLCLILISCSPSEQPMNSPAIKSSLSDSSPQEITDSKESIKKKKNEEGIYELFLGIHNIEYFADRMVLKSKRAGYDFAKKSSIGMRDGVIHYQVILGPFDSLEEAQEAETKIKLLTPDLTISRVVKKK